MHKESIQMKLHLIRRVSVIASWKVLESSSHGIPIIRSFKLFLVVLVKFCCPQQWLNVTYRERSNISRVAVSVSINRGISFLTSITRFGQKFEWPEQAVCLSQHSCSHSLAKVAHFDKVDLICTSPAMPKL